MKPNLALSKKGHYIPFSSNIQPDKWDSIVCYLCHQAKHVVPKGAYFFIQTWGFKQVHLLVGDRHNRVLEFLQKVGDGLVGQEAGHGRQHQVNNDEQHTEEVLHAVLTDSHRWTAALDVILCEKKLKRQEIRQLDVIQRGGPLSLCDWKFHKWWE